MIHDFEDEVGWADALVPVDDKVVVPQWIQRGLPHAGLANLLVVEVQLHKGVGQVVAVLGRQIRAALDWVWVCG